MANVVPLAVSGAIQPGQKVILMSIVNSTPYYLVRDADGIPYFQPLYQDLVSGLAVFSKSAAQVTITLGAVSTVDRGNAATIVASDGPLLVNYNISRVVGVTGAPGSVTAIPIENLTLLIQTLVVCGYEYVLNGGIGFYITSNWSATPELQSIGSLSNLSPATSFYVFPVTSLIDSMGEPAKTSVFSVIYNDVIGRTEEVFLFTSRGDWNQGAGKPFHYCSVPGCGPVCLGSCGKSFQDCIRGEKTGEFSCVNREPLNCKLIATAPFIGGILLSVAIGGIIYATRKNRRRSSGQRFLEVLTKTEKLSVALFFVVIPQIILISMIIILAVNTDIADTYISAICRQ